MVAVSRAIVGVVCLALLVNLLQGGPAQARRWVGYMATGKDVWPG